MSERFRQAMTAAWQRIEEQQWVYGYIGKLNADSSYTYQVPGRKNFVYVTLRKSGGAQTVVPARNDGMVALIAKTPVRLKQEQGIWVIYGRSGRTDLGSPTIPVVNPHTHPVAEVDLNLLGTPTYTTLEDHINVTGSKGYVSGGAISDAGGATINVAAGTGYIRATDSDVAELLTFDWAAANGLAIPANSVRYVIVEYNSGAPQVALDISEDVDEETQFLLGAVVNEAGTLHISFYPERVNSSSHHTAHTLREVFGIRRAERIGGIILGETGTRNLTVTAGELYLGRNEFPFTAIDTSGTDRFDLYYRDGVGGFTKVADQAQWPNTQYDDGDGTLADLTVNRYGVLWVYAELDGDLVVLYGRGNHVGAANAEGEDPPADIPLRLQAHGILIGRVIFQKSAATATEIQTAWSQVFNPVQAADHGALGGLGDDDHTQYVLADGTRILTGDWNIGAGRKLGIGMTPSEALTIYNGHYEMRSVLAGADSYDMYFKRAAAGPGIVASGDEISSLRFQGYDGTDYRTAAEIRASVDDTPGSSDMPGRITFWTTPDASATPAERMRINNVGNFGLGTTDIEAWGSNYLAMQLGARPAIMWHKTNTGLYLVDNMHWTGTSWQRRTANAGSFIEIASGVHIFYVVPSGSADADVTATEAMRIDNAGNVGFQTAPLYDLHLKTADPVMVIQDTETVAASAAAWLYLTESTSGGGIQGRLQVGYEGANGLLRMVNAGTGTAYDSVIMDQNGNVGIGVTPTQKLDIATGHIKLDDGYGIVWGAEAAYIIASDAGDYLRMEGVNVGVGLGGNPSVKFHMEGEARIQGTEATAGILGLYADQGDDNADRWRFVAGTSAYLTVEYFTTGAWNPRLTLNGGAPLIAGIYPNTTASAANVYIQNDDQLFRSTSSLKHKTNVRDLPDTLAVAKLASLRPVLFNSLCEADDPKLDRIGFIAEELDAAGLSEFVFYGQDGEPDGVQYDRLTTLLVSGFRYLEQRLSRLENM